MAATSSPTTIDRAKNIFKSAGKKLISFIRCFGFLSS
jgi:hypothetical protein